MWKWTTIGSDAAWVRRALADDPKAFEVLVERYQKKAQAIARAIGVPEASAEDVVQEAFLKAFESLPQLRQPESFSLWFLSIVRNAARRWHRGARHEAEPLPDSLEAGGLGALETIAQADLRETLWRRIAEMPESIREAVFLYYHEGESILQVSKALAISRSAALKRLERGRNLLREKLWGEMEERLRGERPTDREWTRRARQLSILILGTVGATWGNAALAATASAAGGLAVTGAQAAAESTIIGKLALGGIGMAGKKTAVIAVTSIILCAGLGGLILLTGRGRQDEGGSGEVSGRQAALERSARQGPAPEEAAAAPVQAGGPGEAKPARGEEAPVSISGTVHSAEGGGIKGATVIALSTRRWESLLGEGEAKVAGLSDPLADLKARWARLEIEKPPRTSSDQAGRYRFQGLEEGDYRLLASHDDFLPSTDGWALVAREKPARCDIHLASAESIRGLVVDEAGKPIGGASVLARLSEERRLGPRARKMKLVDSLREGSFEVAMSKTDSMPDGSFRLVSLPPVPHDLWIEKEGLAVAFVPDVPAGESGLRVVLSRGFSIHGRVLGPDRRPASGVQVTLATLTGGRTPPPAVGQAMDEEFAGDDDPYLSLKSVSGSAPQATTIADGKFEFTGLKSGGYVVEARRKGTAPLSAEVLIEGAPVDLGDLQLAASLSISGRVVGSAAQPLAGARVWIDQPRKGGVSWWGGQLYLPGVLAETRSETSGEFVLEGLVEGVYTVRASSKEDAPAAVSGIPAGSGDVQVALEKGWSLKGSVVDGSDGSAIAGAEVVLLTGLTEIAVAEKSVETDAQGSFEIHGVPTDGDNKRLRASHPSYGESREVAVKGFVREGPLRIELYPEDRISGRVVDGNGNGVGGARIIYYGKGVLSAADGSFNLPVARSAREWPPEGPSLFARHPTLGCGWSAPLKPQGKGGAWPAAEIALEPASELRGKVLDSAGIPVARSRIRAIHAGAQGKPRSETIDGYSNQSGEYRVAGLEPGTYTIEVQAKGLAQRRVAGVEVGKEPRELDFTLEAGVAVHGRVVDSDGRPVAGAEVLVLDPDPLDRDSDQRASRNRSDRQRAASGMLATRSGPDGRFELSNLEERELTVIARAPGHQPSDLTVLIPGTDLPDLVLERLSTVAGAVADAQTGRPVPSFRIYTFAMENGKATGNQLLPRGFDDPSGGFDLEGIPSGDWAVVVVARGYVQWIRELAIAPGEGARLEAKLDRGRAIHGSVIDQESGEPIPGVSVVAYGKQQNTYSIPGNLAFTDESGAFTIDGLAPGSYYLYPHCQGYFGDKERLKFQVSDQDPEPIRITLRRGGIVEGKIENNRRDRVIWSAVVLTRIETKNEETGEKGAEAPAKAAAPKASIRIPIDWSGTFNSTSVPDGLYQVMLEDETVKPGVDQTKTMLREDMETKRVDLGQVEVRVGETAVFNAKAP